MAVVSTINLKTGGEDNANNNGAVFLVSFFAFIYYAARGGNMLLGISMAMWSALGQSVELSTGNGPKGVIQEDLGASVNNRRIMFGNWFERVLMKQA